MIKDIRNGVRYCPDGREVCQDTAEGKREYARRRAHASLLQSHLCGICEEYMPEDDRTMDHKQPRGMGGARRDDRQENLHAVHFLCNSAKASRRM